MKLVCLKGFREALIYSMTAKVMLIIKKGGAVFHAFSGI
jgi:hypothetical protein